MLTVAGELLLLKSLKIFWKAGYGRSVGFVDVNSVDEGQDRLKRYPVGGGGITLGC